MDKQSVGHENTDDEFEEYTEEEILDGEEQNEEGSSDEESAEEAPCEEEPDDEDSCAEDSDELEDVLEEDSGEDASDENVIEEDISEESEEEPDGKEPLSGSMDQQSLPTETDVPSLLEQKKTLDAVDVSRASSRKRRSGWDVKAEDVTVVNNSDDIGKRRKTRWSSDVKDEAVNNDSSDVNNRRKTRWSSDKAQSGILLPGALKYDVRLQKLHEKLQLLNQKLEGNTIENLNPSSPDETAGGKKKKSKISPKHNFKYSKKLYVPVKDYPGYNFIGLILGPRGNTLRKMEEETGATIRLRGQGSYLKKTCPHSHDDLHVIIESDSQSCVDAAASMVEKLLVPVEDRQNLHKLAQLRELAELRTLAGGKSLIAKKMDPCDVCGMLTHLTSRCPLTATELQTGAKETHGDKDHPDKQIIPTRVYVGRLPYSLTSDKLKELFEPYGNLCEVTMPLNKSTGLNKGYGIVRYTSSSDAANAIEKMNGYRIDCKELVVRIAGVSPPLDENLPNSSELSSTYPTQTANLQSSLGLAAVPPSSNANLPSYPGLATAPPSSSSSNLPSYPGLVATPSSSKSFMLSYPTFADTPPSSSAILPSYSGLAAIPPSLLSATMPSYPGLAATPTSNSNLPGYPGLASMHLSSLNANLSSYPPPTGLPPTTVNTNLPNNSRHPTLPSPIEKLSNYSEPVDIQPSNSTSKFPVYSGLDVLSSSSSKANLPSFPGFATIPPYSPSTNLPSYPVTPSFSSSNLPSYGRASMHSSASIENPPSYPQPATLPPCSVNANLPSYPRSAALPPSSTVTKLLNYPGSVDIHSGSAVLPSSSSTTYLSSFPSFASFNPSSSANLPSYPGFGTISPSISNENLPKEPRFSSIFQKPEQNTWPGPPGSVLPESERSFFQSCYNSLAQTGRVPSQSASLGKNLNSQNYPSFAAIPREISQPNSLNAVPNELASFPGYLKSIDRHQLDQSAPSSSLSSQLPHFTRNFIGNQINPTLRNYNHPSSN